MPVIYPFRCPECPQKVDVPVEIKLTTISNSTSAGITFQVEAASIDFGPLDEHRQSHSEANEGQS